jgi:hypothetical protein
VEDRRIDHFEDVGAIQRPCGSRADRLVVKPIWLLTTMCTTAGAVATGLWKVEHLLVDALPGNRGSPWISNPEPCSCYLRRDEPGAHKLNRQPPG